MEPKADHSVGSLSNAFANDVVFYIFNGAVVRAELELVGSGSAFLLVDLSLVKWVAVLICCLLGLLTVIPIFLFTRSSLSCLWRSLGLPLVQLQIVQLYLSNVRV